MGLVAAGAGWGASGLAFAHAVRLVSKTQRYPNAASLGNFPIQATGANILRIVCIALVERGVKLCAPVHDAVLIEGTDADIEERCAETQAIMAQAAEVTIGMSLRTDVRIVRYPDRFLEPRGEYLWGVIMELLA